jgi:hypothetical protein
MVHMDKLTVVQLDHLVYFDIVQTDHGLWRPWKPWQSPFLEAYEKQETILKWTHTTGLIRYNVYFKPTEIGSVVTWTMVGMVFSELHVLSNTRL